MKGAIYVIMMIIITVSMGERTFMARTQKRDYSVCPVVSCVGLNDACGYTDMVKSRVITACEKQDQTCFVNDEGTSYSRGTCQQLPSNGAACVQENSNNRCSKGYACNSLLNTCVSNNSTEENYADPGEICGGSVECRFYNSSTGSYENVCTNGVCKYIPDGERCSYDEQCNQIGPSSCDYDSTRLGYYCTAPVLEGGVCNLNYTLFQGRCAAKMSCVPTTTSGTAGSCQYVYSQKSGRPCSGNDQCSKGYCGEPAILQIYGTCVGYKKTSTRDQYCLDSSYCTTSNGEECVCSGDNDGKSKCRVFENDKSYVDNELQLDICGQEAKVKCGALDYTSAECYFNTCGKKLSCSQYKLQKAQGELYDYSGSSYEFLSCLYVQKCDASALLASLPILVAVSIIALFFQ